MTMTSIFLSSPSTSGENLSKKKFFLLGDRERPNLLYHFSSTSVMLMLQFLVWF